MKYTILALLALTLSAVAAPITVNITVSDKEQAALKFATDKFNADAKTTFDAAEAAKKAATPAYATVAYAPLTVVQYARMRIAELFGSYDVAQLAEVAAAPANVTAREKFLALPETERAKIRAQIDAAAAAP